MNDFKDYLLTDLVIGEPITISFTSNNNYYWSEGDRYLQVIELIGQETGEILGSQSAATHPWFFGEWVESDLGINFIPKAETNYLVRVGGFDLSKMTENYTLTAGKSVLDINDESDLDIKNVYYQYDLAISSFNTNAVGVLGEDIKVTWTVTNQGTETISNWYDRFYISDDEYLDESDISIARHYHKEHNTFIDPPFRLEGKSSDHNHKSISLSGLNKEKLTSGDRHLLIVLDDDQTLLESDETNNILSVPIT
ncbi:MAG: CARDB domain-containing protein, partial [Waterburya sp.]